LTANTTYWVTATSIGDGNGLISGDESDRVSATTNSVAGQATFTVNTNVGGDTATSIYRTSGQSVTFSVTAASPDGGTLTYQWRKLVSGSYQDIAGATTNTLTISNLTTSDATGYFVRVTNTKDGTTSDIASSTLNLNVAATLTLATPSTGLTGTRSSAFTTLTISASGGLRNSDTSCAITTGTLPTGLSIAQSGFNCQISGTPTLNGSFTIVATITDSNGATASTNSFTLTIADAAPGFPTITSITASSQQLSVAFTAGTNSGSTIVKYQYSTNGGTNWSDRTDGGTTASPLVITKLSTDGTTLLTNGTSYNIQIRAVNTLNGAATASTAATPVGAAAAPTISAITPSDKQLSVAFTAGATNGATVLKFQFSTDGGATWADRTDAGTTASPLVITKLSSDGTTTLTNGTSYSVQIRAYSTVAGAASTTTSATPAAVPGAPTVTATSNEDKQSVVTWSGAATNGSAITGYTVTANAASYFPPVPAGCQSLPSTATSCTFTGLDNGVAFTFTVKAINAIGTGSAGTATATPGAVPSAPRSFAATSNENGQSVLSWVAPIDNGGFNILGFTVTVKKPDNSAQTFTGSCTSVTSSSSTGCTVTGLTNGVTYTFSITAKNTLGDGVAATTTATPATKPTAPLAKPFAAPASWTACARC
jgi:hypothetical protein